MQDMEFLKYLSVLLSSQEILLYGVTLLREVDETDLWSSLMTGYCVGGVETSGSIAIELMNQSKCVTDKARSGVCTVIRIPG